MPILDIQKRARELGRIRLGQKGDKGQPQKLDRFRLTSSSQPLLEKVAELYGGEVREWTPAGGTQQWEVITDSRRLPIMVPPQPVTQWFEYWTKAGCQHRCDGRHNVLTDDDCDHDDPAHIEALKKPTTRLNVILRDVEGIGVWRVETHGWNAAVELPDVAEFLAAAGGYVNGWLALEQRTSIDTSGARPQTRHFAVPIIEIDVTPAQLMAGGGRVQAPQLEGPVQQAPALAAASDPFQPFFDRLPSAGSLDDLSKVWAEAVAARLVGPQATPSQRIPEFVEAFKARAAVLKPAEQSAPAEQPAAAAPPVVNPDGTVDAEIVEDPAAAAAPPAATAPAAEADPNVVWQQILAHAGGTLGWTTDQVHADFAEAMGMPAGEASAAELAAYLHRITTGEAVSA